MSRSFDHAIRWMELAKAQYDQLGDVVVDVCKALGDVALQDVAGLSTCPSVRVSWTGLSSVRLALGLPQGKLGVTLAYVADTSHSKWAPPKHEHAPSLTRRRL